jgi:hypothetical protein
VIKLNRITGIYVFIYISIYIVINSSKQTIGLDPAGPLFVNTPESKRLDKEDAQ